MKTLKKLFTVLFATALLTSLIACSGADEEETAYGCGELSNTEWIQTSNGTEVGEDYWIKFTATKYINGLVTGYEYDVVINESEKTFKLFYDGADMEKEFRYEFSNDEKTELNIYDPSATGLLADKPLTYKKKN